MRWLAVFTLAAAVALSAASIENTDIQKMVTDEAQWNVVYRCLMDRGPCLGEMKRFKDMLQILVQTKCGRCTRQQKQKFELATKLISEQHPQHFQEIMQKYSG